MPSPSDATYTDAAILEGLRRAAAVHGEPLTVSAYERFFAAHQLASPVRVIQRWTTWNQACTAAGLRVNATPAGPKKRWTGEQLLGHVADYLESPGATGSYADYRAFASGTQGAPSAQTVRNAFGSWSAARDAAREIVAGRAGTP